MLILEATYSLSFRPYTACLQFLQHKVLLCLGRSVHVALVSGKQGVTTNNEVEEKDKTKPFKLLQL